MVDRYKPPVPALSTQRKQPTHQSIGEILRCARLKLQLSPGELAQRAGVARSYITMLEGDWSKPRRITPAITRIASALGIDPMLLVREPWLDTGDTFGALLRMLRTKAGLTQQQLAQRCGSSSTYLAKLEGNVHRPQKASVLRLAAALHVDPDELLSAAGYK